MKRSVLKGNGWPEGMMTLPVFHDLSTDIRLPCIFIPVNYGDSGSEGNHLLLFHTVKGSEVPVAMLKIWILVT